jgi:hypothetical protein
MLVLKISGRDRVLENVVLAKLKRNLRNAIAEVATSDAAVYVVVPDEALSAAFLYSVYLYAKHRGLRVDAFYATSVDLDKVLPEDVKRVGEAWTRRRLSREEIKALRSRFIVSSLLEAVFSK